MYYLLKSQKPIVGSCNIKPVQLFTVQNQEFTMYNVYGYNVWR